MGERYQDMLRAMQLARARSREAEQSQGTGHLPGGAVVPQVAFDTTPERECAVKHLQPPLQQAQQHQHQHLQHLQQGSGAPSHLDAGNLGSMELQTGVRTAMSPRCDSAQIATPIWAKLSQSPPGNANPQKTVSELGQTQDLPPCLISQGSGQQHIQQQQQQEQMQLGQNLPVANPTQPLWPLPEVQRLGQQQAVLHLSHCGSIGSAGVCAGASDPYGLGEEGRSKLVQPALGLNGSGFAPQPPAPAPGSVSDSDVARWQSHDNWQPQQQQQQQLQTLLLLTIQQQQGQQLQQQQQQNGAAWQQGGSRDNGGGGGGAGSPAFVDLTLDDDVSNTGAGEGAATTAAAGLKRRVPASFQGGDSVLKRSASGRSPGLAPGGVSADGTGADGSVSSSQEVIALQRRQDPRQPGAQEEQLLLHLHTVKTRLHDGTMPLGRGSSDMRPMTSDERACFEKAEVKLHRRIHELQEERRQLLQALQQQQRQQQEQQQQQQQQYGGSRGTYPFPPVTTGMPMSRADRYRDRSNGRPEPKPPFLSGMEMPTWRASDASSGAAASGPATAVAAAATTQTVTVAARGVSAGAPSGQREPSQTRVTGHQQALRAVIENLQASESEELEPPPKTLLVKVLRHQRMALAWMIRRETGPEPRGGILADDQGLGKTVTTISLIVTHTNPEAVCRDQRRNMQLQRQGPVEVVDLGDDDDGDGLEMVVDEEDNLEAEEEGEEDVDAGGVRMGALRAEREAAGAADAAEAEGAVVEMLRQNKGQKDGGSGSSGGRAAAATTDAGGGPGGAVIDLLDDDDVDMMSDSLERPQRTLRAQPGASGGASDDTDILSIAEGPIAPITTIAATTATTTATTGRAAVLSLPPTAAGSLSELASSNIAAATATCTAALLATHGQQLAVPSAAGGARGTGGGGCKSFCEAEPRGLLPGGTLVVCPTSVLHQWAREIRDKVSPTAGLAVHVYHGKDRFNNARQLAAMSVVLTTYGTLAQEAPSRDKQAVRMGRQGTSNAPINLTAEDSGGEDPAGKGRGYRSRSKPLGDPLGGALYQIKWKRVVLDEAQSIKNPRTLAAHGAWRLFAHCRWCLSGTPIQNTIDDLYSYFRFLRYEPYCESRKFKELIKGKIAEKPEIGYKFLQAVLQAVLLRRTKQSKINGEPIIKLPAREQQLIKVKFSAAEATFYSQVQAESLRSLKEATTGPGAGSGQNYVNILHSLLKLRQACNHPWLVRGARNSWHKTGAPSASEVEAARKLSSEARAVLMAALSRGDGGGDVQCPCCNDIAEDPVASLCGHVFCAQCLAAQKEGASVEGELLCPACSRLLRGSDLHSAAALAAVDPTAALARAGSSGGGGGGGGGGGDGSSDWISSAKVERLLSLLEGLRAKNREQQAPSKVGGSSNPPSAKSKSDKLMAGALRKLPPLPSAASGGASTSYVGGAGGRPDKVIVFSQWTSMLDLLEIPLRKARIQFRRLDGTMTVANRDRSIQDFESRPDVMVLLVSLKAAALGVNLTVANHVVLMDLWWNPTTEEQAIDRAHRIGQTRTVHVTRITIAGSVEDRILELQQVKRELVAAALSEGRDGSTAAGRLTMDDLRFLVQGLSE